MNERIQKLAEQAGMTRILDEHAHEYGNGMFENTPYPELEKFAELIVRECCVVMFADPRLSDVRSATRGCARSIKEHFGVKE